MKKLCLIFFFFGVLYFPHLMSQPVFYGLAGGGINGNGGIFKYDSLTNSLDSAFGFPDNGEFPCNELLLATDGKFYGMTVSGGANGSGTIFSYDPLTKIQRKLYDFSSTYSQSDGQNSLFQASNGKLYGMTTFGGVYGKGLLFSFDPLAGVFTKLFDFDGVNGAEPKGSLVEAANGKLYGVTPVGGVKNEGVIFSFDLITNTLAKVYDFLVFNGGVNPDGFTPYGSLVNANNGKLYGTTSNGGGALGGGVIFSFDPSNNSYSKKDNFFYPGDGQFPLSGLMQSSNGKLYGTTFHGGANNQGVIYSYDPVTNIRTKLHDFNLTNGGQSGSVLVQANGILYGTAQLGGTYGNGVIFFLDPANNNYSAFYSFQKGRPHGSLRQFGINLYGTNSGGGIAGGEIFSLSLFSGLVTSEIDFNPMQGRYPTGNLHMSKMNRKYYGVTESGGNFGKGTLFSFDPVTNAHIKLYDFDGINGATPDGDLLEMNNGKFYGTSNGGANGYGTIYSFDVKTNLQTKIFDFNKITSGSVPRGMTKGADGKIYGLTSSGGLTDQGTIFSLNPITNAVVKLADLNTSTGGQGSGKLTLAPNGKFYGLTEVGGAANLGGIFSFDPVSNQLISVFDFSSSLGSPRTNSLLLATDGKLYGMTNFGGAFNQGVIFSFDPNGSAFTRLYDFNGMGSYPNGNLIQAKNGLLYGATPPGISKIYGVLFSFDISSQVYKIVKDFTLANGSSPNIAGGLTEFETFIPNKIPTISITSPTNNSSFQAGGLITLNAQASDSDGVVTKVEFFDRGVKFLEDSIAPFGVSRNDVEPGNFLITAKAIDDDGDFAISAPIQVTITACTATGRILAEGFSNIDGVAVADLTANPAYPNSPSISTTLTSMEYLNAGNIYGGRLRGYICVPVTGNYTFYISGDDQAGLWLSTDDNPSNKSLIAYTQYPTDYRQWTKYITQQSVPIKLLRGARYYIETLQKQAFGKDHLSVAWKLPNNVLEGPIPGYRLSPYITSIPANRAINYSAAIQQPFELSNGLEAGLEIKVLPNPSATFFNLRISSNAKEKISFTITDLAGRVVEQYNNVQANGTEHVGGKLPAGVYILHATQGKEKKTLKLVKQ